MNKKIKLGETEINEDCKIKITYPIEGRSDLFDGGQLVFLPYKIVEKDGELFISAETTEYGITPRRYNPFDIPDLLFIINKINLDDYDSITDFCDNYGLMSINEDDPNSFYSESLKSFRSKVKGIKDCLKMYREMRLYEDNPQCLVIRQDRFVNRLNQKLKGIVLRIRRSNFGALVPYYFNDSLESVAYFQLYEHIKQGLDLKECLRCGSLFTPRRPKQVFCPPENGEKRSRCGKQYERWGNWARNEVKTGRKTIEEIALMKNRPLSEVEGWIKGHSIKYNEKK